MHHLNVGAALVPRHQKTGSRTLTGAHNLLIGRCKSGTYKDKYPETQLVVGRPLFSAFQLSVFQRVGRLERRRKMLPFFRRFY